MNYFYISFLLLTVSGAICLVWNYIIHYRRLSKYPVFKPINVFSVSTFIAFMLLFMPKAYESTNNIMITLISAFLDTLDSFSFGNTVEFAAERILAGFEWLEKPEAASFENSFEVIYTVFMIFLAPALTARAVLSIFTDSFTGLRSRFNVKDDLHIFSQLNEKSFSIATDIAEKGGRNKIVFTSVGKDEGFLADRARKINAMLTRKSIRSLKLNGRVTKRKLFLYFIETEEKNNVKDAIDKYEEIKYQERETVMYVFSTQESMEKVVDGCNRKEGSKKVRLEFFNEAQRTAYNLVFDYPFFERPGSDGVTNIMILGAGEYGGEIAKAISWCTRSTGKKYSIKVFDKQDKNESYIFPLKDIKNRLEKVGTELDLEFNCCDIFTDEFNKLRFKRADYIVVALGDDDELNFSAALLMQKLYAREKIFSGPSASEPIIITHIRDNVLTELAVALKDSNIIPYGALNRIFTTDNVSEWKIDKMASFIHAGYHCNKLKNKSGKDLRTLFEEGLDDYAHQSEGNKRSSRATAIHIKYKFSELGIQYDRGVGKLYEGEAKIRENEEALLITEHNRWNTFMMLDGWKEWKNKFAKNSHSDEKSKMHAYLAKFEELDGIAFDIYKQHISPVDSDRMVLQVMTDAFAYGIYDEYDEERISAVVKKIAAINSLEKAKIEAR